MTEAKHYFEAHVTIEPVFDDDEPRYLLADVDLSDGTPSDLDVLKSVAREFKFKVADLLMQKRKRGTQERSKDDTFCTGRSKDLEDLKDRTAGLVRRLTEFGYEVWRYKIEDTILDSKINDEMGLGVGRNNERHVEQDLHETVRVHDDAGGAR